MFKQLLKLLKIKFEGELSLKDGTPIVLDGELVNGVGVMIQSPDGKLIDLPNGSYELSTSEIITVENGLVVDIVEELINKPSPDPGTNMPHGHGPMENHPPDQEWALEPELTPVEDTGLTGNTEKITKMAMTPEEIQKLIDELTARVQALEDKITAMEAGEPAPADGTNPADATPAAAQQALAIEKMQADIETILAKANFSKEVPKYEVEAPITRADVLKQYRRK